MKKKILIAEDDPHIVQLLTTRLVAADFEVCSAQDGAEAIAKSRTEKPDLIIMDVLMPVMSGYEAMQAIRRDPALKNIPAIIMSGRGTMKDFFDGMAKVEFIQKPLESGVILSRVAALTGCTVPAGGQAKRVILAGVEDLLVKKIGELLSKLSFEVLTALHEDDTIKMITKNNPSMAFCQFWEDEHIFDPRKIAQEVRLVPAAAQTPIYVYCKEALSVEAMKHFDGEKILTFRETSDLLRKIEALVKNLAA